ncbi:uncharacterized protein LOC117640446 [Thrips palmi]|uniref:Uncharacterized protein LOC117640446 n=1 Tax=Thrips palmi TaxID=161013 RepID=A0A6P8Y883_THRPL|nr:uncharacterized protein LOC117640446 [Thrips palmi]
MDKLKSASNRKERASPQDEKTLRLSIGGSLIKAYELYKDAHPGSQKTPGKDIYQNVAEQVFARLPDCFVDIVDGKKVGDGKASFTKSFGISVDNRMRDKNKSKPQRAVRGKGIVGVLPNQYQPDVRNAIEQAGMREHLQNLHGLNPTQWDWTEIQSDMRATYELQREDVVKARDSVEMMAGTGTGATEAEETEDDPTPKALAQVKKLWPFLFSQCCLQDHHRRLTGRDIRIHLESYKERKLKSVLRYMTSHSTTNTANLALRLRLKNFTLSDSNKLLCIFFMVANHFKEKREVLFKTVEKTTPVAEVNPPKDICIIALNKEPFEAESYLVCADQTVLVEADDFCHALTSLFELSFIFDLEYPSTMPQTFEYFERSVFQMAIESTKVKDKKGQTVLVLRSSVRDLVNGIEAFETELASLDIENNSED